MSTVIITIDTENDVFAGNPAGEVARILEELVVTLRDGHPRMGTTALRDINGNRVGSMKIVQGETNDGC
jgi:hypothetical protein